MSAIAETVAGLIDAALIEVGVTQNDCRIDAYPLKTFEGMSWLEGRDVLWIGHLYSKQPRLGIGRLAMARVCMLADQHDCIIGLNPWAKTHGGGLLQHQLEAFYQSLGFGWRRDHIMVRETHVPTVIEVRRDVDYLPKPNRVETVIDTTPPRIDVTKTSLLMPVTEDGSIVMANNRRRGLEVPGGHIEPGEIQQWAAMREGTEETGVKTKGAIPIGHLRMISAGEAPEGWQYPHPLSYQSFFAGRVVAMDPYKENDECLSPRIISDLEELPPHVRLLALRARDALSRYEVKTLRGPQIPSSTNRSYSTREPTGR